MSNQPGEPGWNPPEQGWNPPQQPGPAPPPGPAGPYGPPPASPQYPGGAAPGYGPPPAAPKRSRKGCLWAALAVVVLGIAGIGGCTLFVLNLARGPIDAANAWVAIVDEGNFDAAYDNLCADLRNTNDRASVVSGLDATYGGGITDYQFSAVDSTNGVTSVTGTIAVAGQSRPISLVMRKDGDDWKVCTLPT